LAAGWSGRVFSIGAGDSMPIQPHQTARAVRAAILIAACRVNMADKPELMRTCLEDGIKIVTDATKLH
jgi:hypothetical protein